MHIVDGRGKTMVLGGRWRTARHVRYLRRAGIGNAVARAFITAAAAAYVDETERSGCTEGQRRHNRMIG